MFWWDSLFYYYIQLFNTFFKPLEMTINHIWTLKMEWLSCPKKKNNPFLKWQLKWSGYWEKMISLSFNGIFVHRVKCLHGKKPKPNPILSRVQEYNADGWKHIFIKWIIMSQNKNSLHKIKRNNANRKHFSLRIYS